MSAERATTGSEPRRYSDVAPAGVENPTRRRRDRVLAVLRSAGPDEVVTTAGLVDHLRQNRLPDYNYALACKDLNALEGANLARSSGYPKQWKAVEVELGHDEQTEGLPPWELGKCAACGQEGIVGGFCPGIDGRHPPVKFVFKADLERITEVITACTVAAVVEDIRKQADWQHGHRRAEAFNAVADRIEKRFPAPGDTDG